MVIQKDMPVLAPPGPNNSYLQYNTSFSTLPSKIKAPSRLRKNAPTRSNSVRSARSTRTEDRVDVEAYDPFNDEREDIEDSRSLFSEESSRDLWPQMPLSISQKDDDYLPETGPTGTPKRKKTGSTPFKSPKPSKDDDEGFSDGFRVSYTSSIPQPRSSVSSGGNLTKKENNNTGSHPFDESRASSATTTTTPIRVSKPSVLDKYKPSGQEAREGFGFHASQPSPRRLSQSSVSSGKLVSANETEPTNGFRSSFSSAFTPQGGARLSIGSAHTSQAADDNGSVASASQRSTKSSVFNKYTANLSQGTEKHNAPKMVVTPLRVKKSSISNRYLSAVASKGDDPSNSVKPEVTPNVDEPAKTEENVKTDFGKVGARRRSSSFSTAKTDDPAKVEMPAKTKPGKLGPHLLRSSSFSKAKMEEAAKIEVSVKNKPGKVGPHLLRSSSFSTAKMEEPAKTEEPAEIDFGKIGAPRRSSSFSTAKMDEPAKVEVPAKTEPGKLGAHLPRSSSFSTAKMEEPAKSEVPAKTETAGTHLRSSSFSSVPKMWLPPKEQSKKTSVPYSKNSASKEENDTEKMIESRITLEMSKMKIQFDEEVQRIEEQMEQKYKNRIEALEEKTEKMNKIIGKMISKRKSMDNTDMDRVAV
ncbi:unnamed protein product [Cylindrotheca closterium]|uniref:Uncharacterized protein n=1 Tax=Cylindrotheca closterium TaxID=2856 RepID=A0AAD2PY98_9STRA|nr:unnamed protein product [Cylindrotheca closterium]